MSAQISSRIRPFFSTEPLQANKASLKKLRHPASPNATFAVLRDSSGLNANRYYFGQEKWARDYLACHQYKDFKNRWQQLMGSWENKIVVDIGCGPGNLYKSLRKRCGTPRLLVGVDVAQGSLKIAQELGYTTVLADAQQLPFVSGFADIVTVNATLHHSDDMEQVLREAARLVKPGGKLITDHDPQKTMFNNNWIAHLIWNARLPIYLRMKRGGHSTAAEQYWSTATEIHHRPGDGVTPDLFRRVLDPMGFQVQLYPHNMRVGSEIVRGARGQGPRHVRLAQRFTGVDPDSEAGAMMLMCVATRTAT